MRTGSGLLSNVRIVLVAPTHPGNIGAAARAMRTMGLGDLRLVRPRRFRARRRPSAPPGAFEVLDRARVDDNLSEALADCGWAVAATARPRRLEWVQLDPREAGRELVRRAASGPVAAVFGRESAGLTNDEIDRCQAVLRIPTAPDFRSLNIAAAVQIAAYEVARAAAGLAGAAGAGASRPPGSGTGPGGEAGEEGAGAQENRPEAVTTADLERLFVHFETALADIGYLDPERPRLLMRRLRRLLVRADIDRAELNILRGILTAAQERPVRGSRRVRAGADRQRGTGFRPGRTLSRAGPGGPSSQASPPRRRRRPVTNRWTARGRIRCSSSRTRVARDSGVSSGRTTTRARSMSGPASSASVTKWTVQPCSCTRASRALSWVRSPGNAGSREGWMLMSRPANRCVKASPRMRMNPASTTRSARPGPSTRAASASSNSARERKERWSRAQAGMPAVRARSRAGARGTLLTTTAIGQPVSMSAWRLVPLPETRTTIRGPAGHFQPVADASPEISPASCSRKRICSL